LLIAARFLQGMSGGAMLACQIALLSEQFPSGRPRVRAFGWWGVVFGTGLGFGPVIGGGILAAWGWRWVFLVHACIAPVAVLLLVLGTRRHARPTTSRFDVAGVATLTVAILGATFFITESPDLGVLGTYPLIALAVSLVGGALFVVAELRSEHPVIDFRVFRVRAFTGAVLSSAAMNFSFWPLIIYLPLYLESGLGHSAGRAGVLLLAYTLPTLVLPPVAERLVERFRAGVIIPVGLVLIGVGLLLIMVSTQVSAGLWTWAVPGMIVAGVGLGLSNTPTTNTTTSAVPLERSGMASGIDMSARMTSLAINISLMGLLLAEGISHYLNDHLPQRLTPGQLRTLTEDLVHGDISDHRDALGGALRYREVVDAALRHGVGWIALYGGVAALVLAAASRAAFALNRRASRAPASGSKECTVREVCASA
jgi:MFS family permease